MTDNHCRHSELSEEDLENALAGLDRQLQVSNRENAEAIVEGDYSTVVEEAKLMQNLAGYAQGLQQALRERRKQRGQNYDPEE